MFLHYMSTGFGIHKFRSAFSNDLSRNDKIVNDYYNAYIKKQNKSKPLGKVFNTGATTGKGYNNYHNTFNHKSLHCIQNCCTRQRQM